MYLYANTIANTNSARKLKDSEESILVGFDLDGNRNRGIGIMPTNAKKYEPLKIIYGREGRLRRYDHSES